MGIERGIREWIGREFFVFWVGLGEGKRERSEGLEGKKGEREGGEDFLRWEVGKGLSGWECGVRFGE